VNWTQQQKILQSSPHDVVVILDCDFSAAAIPDEKDVSGSGVFEMLTSCPRNRHTESDKESLSAALTEILPILKDQVFSMDQLIQLWAPPIRLQRYRSLRPTYKKFPLNPQQTILLGRTKPKVEALWSEHTTTKGRTEVALVPRVLNMGSFPTSTLLEYQHAVRRVSRHQSHKLH
jgi:hypothetical protein